MESSQNVCFCENQSTQYGLNLQGAEALALKFMDLIGVSGSEVSLTFVDADSIQKLNAQYRDKDKPTDVLSFPMMEWDKPFLLSDEWRHSATRDSLGDIVICLEVASENASRIGQSLGREVSFLILHSFLHLCGHDHVQKADEKLMLEMQKLLMEQFPWDDVKMQNMLDFDKLGVQ